MKNITYCTKVKEDGYERNVRHIERGRHLHNLAIQKMFISLLRLAKSLFRKGAGFSSRNQEAEYFSGGIAAKKQAS